MVKFLGILICTLNDPVHILNGFANLSLFNILIFIFVEDFENISVALTALAEDLRSVPRTDTGWLTSAYILSSARSVWPLQTPTCGVHKST